MRIGKPWLTVSLCLRQVKSGRTRLLGEHLVDFEHSRNVRHGLAKRRYLAAVALHGLFSRVVSRQRQANVVSESIDEKFQVPCAAMHVLPGVEGIEYPISTRRRGHQLHEADRPPLRDRTRIEA